MSRPLLVMLLLLPLAAGATPLLPTPAPPAGITLANGDAAMPDDLTGRWIVTEVAEAEMLPDVPVTLEFEAEGGISGKSGCNNFSASLEISGKTLSPGPARSTRMACESKVMTLEYAFLRALERLSRYEIEGDGTLVLYGVDTVMMRARQE